MQRDWRKEVLAGIAREMDRGGRWLVGVSGGGDSVALLRLLCGAGYGSRVVVGHFDHRWHAGSGEMIAFVQALCGKLRVEMRIGEGNGRAVTNAEAKSREERLGWLGTVCRKDKLAGVMLAHTRTDMVETFLMRAGKGSGVKGLAGMREMGDFRGMRVWRPLLGVGRGELRDYLRGLGQEWREDPDNEAGGSQRARVRKLLPQLASAGFDEAAVAAAMASLRRADEALDAAAGEAWERIAQPVKGGVALERQGLLELPEELGLRVLGRVMAEWGTEGMLPRTGKREDLLARMRGEAEGKATLGGVKFSWAEGTVRGEG